MGFTVGAIAIGAGAVIAADASRKSANTAADAAERAGNKQEAAELRALEQRQRFWEEEKAIEAPWRTAGETALGQLETKMAAGPGEYMASPGYAFRLGEGEKAINRAAAARGSFDSGAAGKALVRYGQDYATNDYDNFLRRYYESLQPYQTLAAMGNQTAVNLGQGAAATGAALSGIESRRGEAAASAELGAGQARATGYANQGAAYGNALNRFGEGAISYQASTNRDNAILNRYRIPEYGGYTEM